MWKRRISVCFARRRSARVLMLIRAVLLSVLPVALQAQDYEYTTANDEVTITEYIGAGGNVTIPATIDGLPVTSIGASSFRGKTTVTSVSIPNSVITIGKFGFASCAGLTNVTIGDGVVTVGALAFLSCSSLTTVVIPESVVSIEGLPFPSCNNLTNITVDAGNMEYSSLDGVLFDKDRTALIEFPAGKFGTFTIPEGVTDVGIAAFSGAKNLTDVIIPDSVITLGRNAFFNCRSLTSVSIGTGVVGIPYKAFERCTSLVSLVVPDNVLNIKNDAFIYCNSLTNVVIGDGVVDVGDRSFSECTSLVSVMIGNGATRIGASAFIGCSSLETVVMGDGVATISYQAFASCQNLTRVYLKGNPPNHLEDTFINSDNIVFYFLPEATGWSETYGGRPTAVWPPKVQTADAMFGVVNDEFGFNISWANDLVVDVEASDDLSNPNGWNKLTTVPLTDGSGFFSDPNWASHPGRFYRLRMP